jgi:hypothetical protein
VTVRDRERRRARARLALHGAKQIPGVPPYLPRGLQSSSNRFRYLIVIVLELVLGICHCLPERSLDVICTNFQIPWEWPSPTVRRPHKEHGGITRDGDHVKPARLSGPYRAKRLCMFTQAKAWAEFSWPFGPSASPLGNPSTSVILRPEGP